MIVVVSTIIFTTVTLVISGVLFPEPEPRITWYFIPGGCLSMIPEWTTICHSTEECGQGHLAKSIKGHGPVDKSELWKWKEGLVKIDYTRCGEEVPGVYFP